MIIASAPKFFYFIFHTISKCFFALMKNSDLTRLHILYASRDMRTQIQRKRLRVSTNSQVNKFYFVRKTLLQYADYWSVNIGCLFCTIQREWVVNVSRLTPMTKSGNDAPFQCAHWGHIWPVQSTFPPSPPSGLGDISLSEIPGSSVFVSMMHPPPPPPVLSCSQFYLNI